MHWSGMSGRVRQPRGGRHRPARQERPHRRRSGRSRGRVRRRPAGPNARAGTKVLEDVPCDELPRSARASDPFHHQQTHGIAARSRPNQAASKSHGLINMSTLRPVRHSCFWVDVARPAQEIGDHLNRCANRNHERLSGRRIALLESRSVKKSRRLVRRLGGVPITAPAMDEVPCHQRLQCVHRWSRRASLFAGHLLDRHRHADVLGRSQRRGRLDEATRSAAKQTTIACRGAKPLAALKRHGLRAQITTGRPHTTRELMSALPRSTSRTAASSRRHGERNRNRRSLRRVTPAWTRCARTSGRFRKISDPITGRVVRDAIAHRLDAVLFTSQVQCRHLFRGRRRMGQLEGLALSSTGTSSWALSARSAPAR